MAGAPGRDFAPTGDAPPGGAHNFEDRPRWLDMYPRLLSEFKEMMEEWMAEREGLLLQAEQTQAYCSSLAFQVKSLQEENAELRTALAADEQLAIHSADAGAGVYSADDGAGVSPLQETNGAMPDEPAEVAKSPSQVSTASSTQGSAAAHEHHVRFLSPTRSPSSPTAAKSATKPGDPASKQASSVEKPVSTPRSSRTGSQPATSKLQSPLDEITPASPALATARAEDVSVGLDEGGEGGEGGSSEWVCTFTSAQYAQPVHGIASSGEGGAVAAVSWDGTCMVFKQAGGSSSSSSSSSDRGRARERGGGVNEKQKSGQWVAQWAQPAQPGPTGLYSVKFGGRSARHAGRLAVACADGTCYVLAGADGGVTQRLAQHTDEVNDVDFLSPTVLATVSDDQRCLVWDLEKGAVTAMLSKEHTAAVYGVKFSPSTPNTLATVAFDKLGMVWDIRSGSVVQKLKGHTEEVIGLSFSPCGVLLATGSDDCTCKLWDVRRADRPVLSLDHADEVKRVAWSPCGAMVATACADKMPHVWRVGGDGGAQKQSLVGHADLVFDIQWLPAGRRGPRLISASHDCTWRAWGPAPASSSGSSPLASRG